MPAIDFKGKQIIYAHHLGVPVRVLTPHLKKSFAAAGENKTADLENNLIIHGDNLHALKSLLPRYAARVNCIYIDPPYNTGNEKWAYNDNVNSPMMREWLKNKSPVDGEDLERHDKWLCMMWPRLQLLRELLADDGVIFISIDDNEQHRLRMMMDEIFGDENFLSSFIWKSRQIVDSRPKSGISNDHEYIVAYRKNDDIKFVGKESDTAKYTNPDKDPRGPWMSNSILGLANKKQRPNLHYVLVDPKTGNKYSCPPDTGWRFAKDVLMAKVKDGRIVFPKKKDGRPREKKFLAELTSAYTGFSSALPKLAGYTLNGTREVREIFQSGIFEFPKPVSLVKMLLEQIPNEDAIILDSFAGSATTAHATLALNAEDGGTRKFILVECENYADTITAERIRRIIKGVPTAKDQNLKTGLPGRFTYCTLGEEINAEKMLTGKNLPAYETLARHLVWTATGHSPTTLRTQTKIGKVKDGGFNYGGFKNGFFYESPTHLFYLIYQPDIKFLQSTDSALNNAHAKHITTQIKKRGKPAMVFATHKFFGQKDLSEMQIVFCGLPFGV